MKIDMSDEIYRSRERIKRSPMTMTEFNKYMGGSSSRVAATNADGYLLEYLGGGTRPNHPDHEGYISWLPEEEFDAYYTLIKEEK